MRHNVYTEKENNATIYSSCATKKEIDDRNCLKKEIEKKPFLSKLNTLAKPTRANFFLYTNEEKCLPLTKAYSKFCASWF